MLRLRKILLCKYLYFIILLLVIMLSIMRMNLKRNSNYVSCDTTFIVTIEDIFIDGAKLTLNLVGKDNLIASYYFKSNKEKQEFINNVNLGDKLYLTGKLNEPITNSYFDGFNYKTYLYQEDVFYTLKIESIKKIQDNSNIYYLIKNFIVKRISNIKKTSSYISTFLIGNTKYLNEDIKDKYRLIGVSHLFAISGSHISLISVTTLYILKKLKLKETKRYIIVFIELIFYLFLTDFLPSILRAVIFFILLGINKIFYFYIKTIHIFILTLSLCLLINPYFIYNVGFLYSFVISFFLIIASDFINKEKPYFKKLLIISFISFIVSIPISLYNFNQINLLSIIYNLLYVPLISYLVFPLSIITFIFPILDNLYFIIINFLEYITNILGSITFSNFIFCKINIIWYFIYYLLISLLFTSHKKRIISIILVIMLLIHYYYPNINSNNNYIVFLDVGQGDSTLVYSKGEVILVDTGGKLNYYNEAWSNKKHTSNTVLKSTIPYLKQLGIKKINYLILTHGDEDHAKDAISLLKNFKVETILINDNKLNSLEKKISLVRKDRLKLKQFQTFNVGNIKVLSLNKNLIEENDSSLVLKLTYNKTNILLMGDASVKSEEEIMNDYDNLKVDIIKLGHHGSRTSSSLKFLKKTKPSLAIISAGKDNRFKHPHYEVIKRLKKLNIKYLITYNTGSIKIDLDNDLLETAT